MNYLSVENLSKSYDEKLLFEGITFGLDQGQKVALVGVNGCGKSTLLKVIGGFETQDKGEVSFRNGLKVSFLSQRPDFDDDATVGEAVFSDDKKELNLIRQYEDALTQASLNPETAPDMSDLIEEMDRLNVWEYEQQVKQLLGKLGIHDFSAKMSTLSGGQRKRVALAQALVVKPDFLILDEPTNHLDLEVIEWLENFLASQNLTLLMVTHDRYFLDRVTTEIMEIDRGEIFRYKGNYSAFLEKKAERQSQDASTVGKARNLMKKELDWMRRQPKARGTKSKYRIEAFHDLKKTANKNLQEQEMKVQLKGDRQGKKIIELQEVSKSFGDLKIMKNFSYVFRKGEKVGIIGPNGVGKSTFLQVITQSMRADEGKLDVGQTTKFGYYTQDETVFDPNKKVIEIVQEVAEYVTLGDGSQITASQLLNQFLFPPKMQHNFVGKLSGGEKRRLQLMRVLMANPNFLILDEPTNDLDIMTLNVLEDYLDNFPGCLMVVSHDRYFMDRLVDHLFVFEGNGKIKDFPGNYTDYRDKEGVPLADVSETKSKSKQKEEIKSKEAPGNKLSYNEQREFSQIESMLPKLQSEKKELELLLNQEGDYEKLIEMSKRIEDINQEIDEKEMRWLELSERT
ncbi:MAG: ABC-F family ATP-binding cassette domain-containing protein [Cyclobacteriaceae bacterium]